MFGSVKNFQSNDISILVIIKNYIGLILVALFNLRVAENYGTG